MTPARGRPGSFIGRTIWGEGGSPGFLLDVVTLAAFRQISRKKMSMVFSDYVADACANTLASTPSLTTI